MNAPLLSLEALFEQRLANSRVAYHCNSETMRKLMSLSQTRFKKVFAQIVNTANIIPSNITPVSIIQVADLPDVSELRKEYEPLLCGVRQPETLNLFTLLKTAWSHEQHEGLLFKHLVPGWKTNHHDVKKIDVDSGDLIHGHYGFTVLKWIEQNWKSLPKTIRRELQDKRLYGWADVSSSKRELVIPILTKSSWSSSKSPTAGWYFLRDVKSRLRGYHKNCFGVRE